MKKNCVFKRERNVTKMRKVLIASCIEREKTIHDRWQNQCIFFLYINTRDINNVHFRL